MKGKILKFLLLVLLVTSSNLFSQTANNIIVPRLTNKSVKVKIPKHSNVNPYVRDGIIQVKVESKIAYLDLTGNYIYGFNLKLQTTFGRDALFDCAATVSYSENYALANAILCKDKKMFPLDKKYTQVSDFCDGIAVAIKKVEDKTTRKISNHLVYLDVQGKEVLTSLSRKVEGFTKVPMYVSPVSEGLRAFYDASLGKWGYADEKGVVKIQPRFSEAIPFSEGLAAVQIQKDMYSSKTWGFIDKTGKEIISCQSYNIQPTSFREGYAIVKTGDEWSFTAQFINKTGKEVSPEYKNCNSFYNGYAYAFTNDKKNVLIDNNFSVVKEISDFSYQKINYKKPFGLEFIGGLAACGYEAEIPNGNLITYDGEILFAKDGRNVMYNYYDSEVALCRYRIDDKEIEGFINRNGEFVLYFEEDGSLNDDSFNITTAEPTKAPCLYCNTQKPKQDTSTSTIKNEKELIVDTIVVVGTDIKTVQDTGKHKGWKNESQINSINDGGIIITNPPYPPYPPGPKGPKDTNDTNDTIQTTDSTGRIDSIPPNGLHKDSLPQGSQKTPTSPEQKSDPPNNLDNSQDSIIYAKDSDIDWYKGRVAIRDSIYQSVSIRKKGEPIPYNIVNTNATILMGLSHNGKMKNPYDSLSYGVIWIIPDTSLFTFRVIGAVTKKELPQIVSYVSFPYSIASLQKDSLGFGIGSFGYFAGVGDEKESDGIGNIGVLQQLSNLDEGLQVIYSVHYNKKADGSIQLTSTHTRFFDNLTLKPYSPNDNILIEWRPKIKYLDEVLKKNPDAGSFVIKSGNKVQKSPEIRDMFINNIIKKYYPKLKKYFSNK